MQIAYTHYFWKIRREGLKENYYDRIRTANRVFFDEGKPGWKTDRGYILTLCGSPQYLQKVTVNDLSFMWISNPSNRGVPFRTPAHDTDGTVYIIWEYYHRNGRARFVFNYSSSGYKLDYGGIVGLSNQRWFIEKNREAFNPTPTGWEMWGEELYRYVKKKEKK